MVAAEGSDPRSRGHNRSSAAVRGNSHSCSRWPNRRASGRVKPRSSASRFFEQCACRRRNSAEGVDLAPDCAGRGRTSATPKAGTRSGVAR